MIHQSDQTALLDDEMSRLAVEVSELGILCMDAFKYAAESLFGSDAELARFAADAASSSASLAIIVHQKTVAILARWSPAGSALHRIIGLQRTSTEYARIAANAHLVAQQAGMLSDGAEPLLTHLNARAPRLLANLVHQVFIALRGCLILMNSGDRGLARRILSEDSELERVHASLYAVLSNAIGSQPQHIQDVRRLIVAFGALRQIGVSAVIICEGWLS